MSVINEPGHATEERHPLEFPPTTAHFGPVTRARLTRAWSAYSVIVAVGLLLVVIGSAGWKSVGLGLMLPGAGFLYSSSWWSLFGVVIAAGLAYLSYVVWFAAGNIVFPVAVWLGAAVVAGLTVGSGGRSAFLVIVPVLAASFMVTMLVRERAAYRRGAAARVRYNETLRSTTLPAVPAFESTAVGVGPELTADDLAFLRWFLDRGLQPLDDFTGFTFIDQFQFAAVRYQINMVQYALAMAQYTRTPAFHGYLSEAQRNLILKIAERRVWHYWRIENLWGNLRYNPDPMVRDNIMLTGYLGQMLGLYESITGDRCFDAPGALTFAWTPSRRYEYDHDRIVAALVANFSRQQFGFYPCEPNWIYFGCNQYGMASLKLYDRVHGTTYFAGLRERLLHAIETEFTTTGGSFATIRSSRIGCQIPLPPPFSGLTKPAKKAPPAAAAFNIALNAIFPELGERALALTTDTGMRAGIISGRLDLRTISEFDLGFYRDTGTGILPFVMATAVELGDAELYEALRQQADDYLKPVTVNGARHYEPMSPLCAGLMFQGRFSRAHGWYDVVNRGNLPAWDRGPILDAVNYPDVLVARAVTDGEALDLVLRPGIPEAGRQKLGLARLVPGRTYRVSGAVQPEVTADEKGSAVVDVDLGDRLVVRVEPQP
jgi:hypothetical protein